MIQLLKSFFYFNGLFCISTIELLFNKQIPKFSAKQFQNNRIFGVRIARTPYRQCIMRWSGCSPFTKFPENPVEKEMEHGNGIFGSTIFAGRNRMLQIEIRVPSLIPVSGSRGRFFSAICKHDSWIEFTSPTFSCYLPKPWTDLFAHVNCNW